MQTSNLILFGFYIDSLSCILSFLCSQRKTTYSYINPPFGFVFPVTDKTIFNGQLL